MSAESVTGCTDCKLVRFVAPNGSRFCLPSDRAAKFLVLQKYPGESKHATVLNCDRPEGKVEKQKRIRKQK